MTQPVTAFNGQTIYLDTMIPYALLRNIDAQTAKTCFNVCKMVNFLLLHPF